MGLRKPTTCTHKNPHLRSRVWVSTGTGAGCPGKPQGCPSHSLIADDSNEAKDPLANSSDVEEEAPIDDDANEAMGDLLEDEEVERAKSGAAVESQEPSSGSLDGKKAHLRWTLC